MVAHQIHTIMASPSTSSAAAVADSQSMLIQESRKNRLSSVSGGTDESRPGQRNIEDVLSGMKLGAFHWRMLGLVGGGYFAVCAEMMLFIFLSGPVSEEWDLGNLEFPWLPFW